MLRTGQEGDRFVFTMECPNNGDGLYKAFLNCSGGRRLLGTMLPEGNHLWLRRTLSKEESKTVGTVFSGEAVLSYRFPSGETPPPGWKWETSPWGLFQDAVLVKSSQNLKGALLREENNVRLLALPFDGGAFPLTPLFCFAKIYYLSGRPYAVFRLGKNGKPAPPHPQ